jgi:NADPH:quinone reductase-like Zn-dependent oxidoreductase
VFEHSGEATLPTSIFVCATGGMVMICAGTSGYNVTMDLRYGCARSAFMEAVSRTTKKRRRINACSRTDIRAETSRFW